MNNPFILDKVGIEHESINSNLREEVDLLTENIKLQNASVDNFEIDTTPINIFWSYFDCATTHTINMKKYLSEFIC